jgi:hypothetical protein
MNDGLLDPHAGGEVETCRFISRPLPVRVDAKHVAVV